MKVIPDSENRVMSDLMIQVEAIQYRLGKIRKTDVSREDIAAIITGGEMCVRDGCWVRIDTSKGDSKNAG